MAWESRFTATLALPDEVEKVVCGGGAWPTQRGGGVDHPNEVQQINVQTERHIFLTPSPITTRKSNIDSL